MKIQFWGTRGSIPVPGKNTLKYGGNTPCVQVLSENKELLILDGGTGIRELGDKILSDFPDGVEINILISHTHWDHIHGLLFFRPFYFEKYKINLFSNENNGMSVKSILTSQMHPNFFPVSIDNFKAEINYFPIMHGQNYFFEELKIKINNTHHSKGTLSFRIFEGDKNFVYMTDNELYYKPEKEYPELDSIALHNAELIEFVRGADLIIHDSAFNLKDYKRRIGWGHSNNIATVMFAHLAEVNNLFLFHYDPIYKDEDIDILEKISREKIEELNSSLKCKASYEGLALEI